jgi:hypothetical protein
MIPTEQFSTLAMPFLSALVALVFTLWFKDFATKIAKGLAFQMNKSFNPGDRVILDGEPAVIVSIGVTQTVFATYKTQEGSTHVETLWRYVPNERIPYLKLEKVITDSKGNTNG